MTLSDLGFSDFFQDCYQQLQHAGVPARVTRVNGELCQLRTETAELRARIPRRICKLPPGPPLVGDWVVVDPQAPQPQLQGVLPRRTLLARAQPGRRSGVQLIAANVDVVFVVTGLDGDFNPRRIERYLALVADSGARAVVLLTKAAICDGVASKLAQVEAIATGVPVHAIDVPAGINDDALTPYLRAGTTLALVGSSGAGKSTLVNHLSGEQRMATGAVRTGDDRGRHTTTHRELIWLPQGAALIDNPGMRELQLWVDGDGLQEAFVDVDSVAQTCRFSDCSHRHEPGCAVQRAIRCGELPPQRVDSYLKLQAEIESTRRRHTIHQKRADERALGKKIRNAKRRKRGRR